MRSYVPSCRIPHRGFVVWRAWWRCSVVGLLLIASWFDSPAFSASLNWEQGPQGRSASVKPEGQTQPHLTLLSPVQTGISFTNRLSLDRYTTNQIYLNGSGVAAGDVDGDGWCDLYFCNLDGPNALYRNLGDWKFQDITQEAGVGCPDTDATGAAFADLDGDGDLDLIVNTIGSGTRLFFNDGKGRFTEHAPLNLGKAGMSMALGDIDGDGALDLYVCNYRTQTLRDQPKTNFRLKLVDGRRVISEVNGVPASHPDLAGRFSLSATGRILEHGEVDAFYRNTGKGDFEAIPFVGGAFLDEEGRPLTEAPHDWGLSVMMRDINGDGAPDIYVCNDFDSPDRVWINDGHGHFRAIARTALRSSSKFSMGIDFADINRDGFDDFLVLDMMEKSHSLRLTRADRSVEGTPLGQSDNRPQVPRNTLQLNRGDGTYAEIAFFAGLAATGWSWTPAFLDVDLDGYEDLLITAGHGRDDMDLDTGMRLEAIKKSTRMSPLEELALRKTTAPLPLAKQAYRNLGGDRFEQIADGWGFNQVGITHGLCLADLDNDGDLDVVVNSMNEAAGVYRNDAIGGRVGVRLKGSGPNSQGIGATIRLIGGAVPIQQQQRVSGGRYLSGDEGMRVFAVGEGDREMTLEVRWRDGKTSRVPGLRSNRIYEINHSGAALEPIGIPGIPVPLFEDVSTGLGHQHHEENFDDFSRQPLLPNRLSQLGPGVAWIDLDGDGREELVISGGKGGELGVYRHEGNHRFQRLPGWGAGNVMTRDQVSLVGMEGLKGDARILVNTSNYEDLQERGGGVQTFTQEGASAQLLGQDANGSIGPLALCDLDADGDLDLFVGGRVAPERYPESGPSAIYQNRNGAWVKDEANSRTLAGVGMVSGAVWSDLDGDGFPELILACEWGPVRIFKNDRGTLKERTKEWGLAEFTGWWNGVTAGDFDGDGRMDLVASNWGLNSKYQASASRPRRLYFGDLGLGRVEVIEAYYEESMKRWVPERDLSAVGRAMPFVRERYSSNASYAQAGVEEIFGERLRAMKILAASSLETTVWLNRGDHFEKGTLPSAAQYSPAFGVSVGDLNGDGHEDLLMSQNFFAVQSQTSRNDAGRGLVLKGDGRGHFEELDARDSGIRVYGEQRGSALADYDGDGRLDWAVSQNGGETKLYHNVNAKPGLRVRVKGTAGNPNGIGCTLRLRNQKGWGPTREIHAGSGYGSQDGATQVMPGIDSLLELEIGWPGGQRTRYELTPFAKEVSVEQGAKLELIR